jgi:hypothetical protein
MFPCQNSFRVNGNSKKVDIQNLSGCRIAIFWAIGPCNVLGLLRDANRVLGLPLSDCFALAVDGRKRQVTADTRSKPRETARSRSRALSRLWKGAGPDGRDWGRASQFDPAIDKERKLISNLRRNMPVFVQTVPNIRPSGQHDKAIDKKINIQHVHDVM